MRLLNLVFLWASFSSIGCAPVQLHSRPPSASLPATRYSEERLRASDLTFRFAPVQEPAGTPTTTLTISDGELSGIVRVRKARHPRDSEPVPAAVNRAPYLIARRAAKRYRWGSAESCFAQFTNEAYGDAPNNDALTYQVAGMTDDGRFSVFCSFPIRHPRLPMSSNAEHYRAAELDRLESHPDRQMIEKARDGEFQPSIRRIDRLIDSLEISE